MTSFGCCEVRVNGTGPSPRDGEAPEPARGILRCLTDRVEDRDLRWADEVLRRLAGEAVAGVPAAGHAGLTVGGTVQVAGSEPAGALLRSRVGPGAGPGPDGRSARDGRPVLVADLGVDDRWPLLGARTAARGIRSWLSVPVPSGTHRAPDVLTLLADRPHAFDAPSVAAAERFAAELAVAVHHVRTVVGLEQALHRRDIIGQAKGVLVERHTVSSEEAFAALVRRSQHSNTKLVEIARQELKEVGSRNGREH